MKRKDKIKEAYKAYMDNGGMLQSNLWFAFKAGAEWADTHPVNVWHDASEEPKEYPIIYQDEFSDVWILQFSLKNFVDGWEDFKGFECVTRWAYIKDLLPKGDGGGETIL